MNQWQKKYFKIIFLLKIMEKYEKYLIKWNKNIIELEWYKINYIKSYWIIKKELKNLIQYKNIIFYFK